MNFIRTLTGASVIVLALGLTACGGSDGGGIAAIPAAPLTPTPTPTAAALSVHLITNVSGDTTFAGQGSTFDWQSGGHSQTDPPQVRYVAATQSYEVKVPSDTFRTVFPASSGNPFLIGSGANPIGSFSDSSTAGLSYSNLISWSASGTTGGVLAFGIPTSLGNMPVQGSASYAGLISGFSTEKKYNVWDGDDFLAFVGGTIGISFNFGAGTLSGSISPVVYGNTQSSLGEIPFKNTVYSTGSTTFSGEFDTAVPGTNNFSGQFTGPAAQELIGSFAFPYVSLGDGKTYNASGAFVGKH